MDDVTLSLLPMLSICPKFVNNLDGTIMAVHGDQTNNETFKASIERLFIRNMFAGKNGAFKKR